MHWTRKIVGKYQYLYIYLTRNKPLKPRSLYSHLDSAPDHAVETWLTQYKAQYGGPVTPDHVLFSDDTLNKHLTTYRAFLLEDKQRSPLTVANQLSVLRRYVIPYFLSQDPPLKDPATWPSTAVWMARYLQDRGCRPRFVADINNALSNFWRWLQQEHLAPRGIGLELRTLPGAKSAPTPLSYTLTPDDILDWVKGRDPRVQLLALCGYFFSLRPQETFALCSADFSVDEELDSVKAMIQARLYGGLSVHIERQLTAKGAITAPKAHSKGYVTCFDLRAATLIVDLVNAEEDPSRALLGGDVRWLYRLWQNTTKGSTLEGTTLKDLRRASIYWLGHHSGMAEYPITLKNHARHRELETTELYLRRPETDKPQRTGKLKLRG